MKKSLKWFVLLALLFATTKAMKSQEKYAVLIVGDYAREVSTIPENERWGVQTSRPEGMMEFWNDLFLMHRLLEREGFDSDNIFVLFADGNDYHSSNPNYIPSLGDTITDYAATLANVEMVFNGLISGCEDFSQIKEDDFLFVWTFGHGNSYNNGSYISLLGTDKLYDETLNSYMERIPAHKKVFWMQQCHGGGFGNVLANNSTIFLAACRGDQLAHPADDKTNYGSYYCENEFDMNMGQCWHGEFDYHVLSVCRGESPSGQTDYNGEPYSNGDTNSDGFISMYECSEWERTHESIYSNIIDEFDVEVPVYIDPASIGVHTTLRYPTLLFDGINGNETCRGTIGISKDLFVDEGQILTFEGNSNVTLCNSTKIVIREGGTLRLTGNIRFFGDSSNEIIVEGNFIQDNDTDISFNNVSINASGSSLFIQNANFMNSTLRYDRSLTTGGNVVVKDCSFYNPQKVAAIEIDGSDEYVVEGNSISSTDGIGVFIKDSGRITSVRSSNRVRDNVIHDCNGGGLVMYHSGGDIIMNHIYNNLVGVKLLNNCNIRHFTGRCGVDSAYNTQYIHDNNSYEIYMSRDCFPALFEYNCVESSTSHPYIYCENTGRASQIVLEIKHNNWGSSFSANYHLQASDNATVFHYNPVWSDVSSCFQYEPDYVQEMLQYADSLAINGEFERAQIEYMRIVENYPNTTQTIAALKSLVEIATESNNLQTLQKYYKGMANISNDKLCHALYNQCDIGLANYEDALAYYYSIINGLNSTYNDSVFAVIDKNNIEQLYLKQTEVLRKKYDDMREVLSYIPKNRSESFGSRDVDVYWTDSVTTRPDGYLVDEMGNVAISTAEGFAWLISTVNGLNGQEPDSFEGRTVTLLNEIDLDGAMWTPIGTEKDPFKGTFEGNGYLIYNISIYLPSENYLGLFGWINSAIISNVFLRSGYIYGYSYIGGIVAMSDNNSLVENCTVRAYVSGSDYTGGIVSQNRGSRVLNCRLICSEVGLCHLYDGTIASVNQATNFDAVISNCYSTSLVTVLYCDRQYTGGIVSINKSNDDHKAIVSNCYTVPNGIKYCFDYGVIAAINDGGEVRNCYYSLPTNDDESMFFQNSGIFENNSYFSLNEGTGAWEFPSPVMVGEVETNNLVNALNAWCLTQYDYAYYGWVVEESSYPTFDGIPNQTQESECMKVFVYPNPSHGSFTIFCGKEEYNYALYNVMGQMVASGMAHDRQQINIGSMAKGIYLLKVSAGAAVETHRIVVE